MSSPSSRLYDSQGRLIEGPVPDKSVIITLPDGNRKALWIPFPKQVQFHESTITNLMARGSRGSGKSDLLRWDAHMRAMTIPNCVMVLIRSTLKQLQQSHLLFIREEMKQLGGYYHGTNYCAHYPTGSKLFFSYVGHEDDAMNLLGAELAAAYFDELSVIPWDYFMKLQASVRVKRSSNIKAVIRAATNPFGESAAEIEKFFVTKELDLEDDEFENYDPEEWGYIQINMEDNPYIDVEQYKRRFVNLPPHLRKAWLYGEYADEAALFDFHTKHPETGQPYHVIEDIDLPSIIKAGRLFRAFDMGWFPDPAYCCWIAHLGNRFVVIHEKVWYKTIIEDISRSMFAEEEKLGIRGLEEEGPTKRILATFCDPSMDIHTGAEVRSNKGIFEGYDIPMECSVNDRGLFASVVHQALAEQAGENTPRLQVYRGNKVIGAPYMVKALPLMRMDPKRTMYMANHVHDHPVVALAYFLISYAANEYRRPEEMRVPKWMVPKKSKHRRWTLGDEAVRRRDDN